MEQTLEQQAAAWVANRDFVVQIREKYRHEPMSLPLQYKPEVTNPQALQEPLQTEVLRQMALQPTGTTSTAV
jgi:hypothetical protein